MKTEDKNQDVAVVEQTTNGVSTVTNPDLSKMRVNAETGEMFPTLASSNDVLSMENKSFIHVRNDCSASGGCFKVGDTVIGKEMRACLIAVMPLKNTALFTKKGEEPKYQNWVHLLFIDEKYGNLKSTLIKTRSILGIIGIIKAAMAVNESPIGLSFVMRFADAEGKNEKGETFKYKYVIFDKNDELSPHKQTAIDTRQMIDDGIMAFPSLESLM